MAAVVGDLAAIKSALDLTHDGLGGKAAEATAAAVFEYMEVQVDPDNNPWVGLSDAYAERKARLAPGAPMAEFLGRVMKDPDQLRGELDISPDRMEQTYGLTDQARNEAAWFQEGDPARNRPAREFYAFNDLATVYLADLFDDRWDKAFP
jgi:hypothetical protein